MTDIKHTALPWSRNIRPITKYPIIFAGRNTHVLQIITRGMTTEEAEGNADLLLRAVNRDHAFDDLVEMVKLFEKTALYEIEKNKKAGDDEGARCVTITLHMIRAALAKAGSAS